MTCQRTVLKQEDEDIARKQVKRKITIDVSTKGELKRSTKKRRTEGTNKKKEEASCDVCKTTFNMTRTEFRKHMLNHGKFYTFQCDVCSKKFKYKHNMQRHKIKVHGEATIYACRYCDFATIHCSYLKVHVTRKHTNDFRYCCDKCDRKFRIKADYTKHSMSHVNETCICDICGTSLSNKLSLYFHKNYKHKLRDSSYQCPVCKKKLQSQKNLSIHLRQHERRYACEECGMELTRKTALKRHIKTHSGEKPYPCHICNKSFVSTTVRKNHFLTHSGVRPYVCTICNQSFVQRPALSVHWKKKHPECSKAPPSVSIKDIIKTVTGNTTIKNL